MQAHRKLVHVAIEAAIPTEQRVLGRDGGGRLVVQRVGVQGIALEHPYWTIDKERLLGSDALNGLIEQWIDSEATRSDGKSRLVPEFYEVAFGTGGGVGGSSDTTLSASKEIEIYDVKVRGKVDRVEIVRDGDIVYNAVAAYALPLKLNIVTAIAVAVLICFWLEGKGPRRPEERTA